MSIKVCHPHSQKDISIHKQLDNKEQIINQNDSQLLRAARQVLIRETFLLEKNEIKRINMYERKKQVK